MAQQYHYTAFMPVDGSRKIVHLRCDEEDAQYRFVAFREVHNGEGAVEDVRESQKGGAIFLKIDRIDEESIKKELATFHDAGYAYWWHIKIEPFVVPAPRVRGRDTEIPSSAEYESAPMAAVDNFAKDLLR